MAVMNRAVASPGGSILPRDAQFQSDLSYVLNYYHYMRRSPQHPRIRLITNFPGNPPLLVRTKCSKFIHFGPTHNVDSKGLGEIECG